MGWLMITILDTKGPETGIRRFGEKCVTLDSGDAFTLTTEDVT